MAVDEDFHVEINELDEIYDSANLSSTSFILLDGVVDETIFVDRF